jgi:hypothetical protein
MTNWGESHDDPKDTWYWMGVVISLAYTIGLNRNPEHSSIEPRKKKLRKRVWWSIFMQESLVALAMRRTTRIKNEDYDVPMLTENDFEIVPLPGHITTVLMGCTLARDVQTQRQLAQMCIAQTKLCLCINHVLGAQYSPLVQCQGMRGQEGTVMLFPKTLDQRDEVQRCDLELDQWFTELPASCKYSNEVSNCSPIFVGKALLNMTYFATLSALHRPQVISSASIIKSNGNRILRDTSQRKVREASRELTYILQDLYARDLDKYLPMTAVTVLLPAIIIHLLDAVSCRGEARQASVDGFYYGMLVLEKLRSIYASAEFAAQFVEGVIRKADIDVMMRESKENRQQGNLRAALSADEANEMQMRSESARWIPLSVDHGSVEFDFHESHVPDISIPLCEHKSITSDRNLDCMNLDPLTLIEHGPTTGAESDVDLNLFLTFDSGHKM